VDPRACAESVTHLAEPNITESASRLSDITFRTCLADREGPVDLLACDEAERRTAVGDTRQAAGLLAPVLDRTLLVHGRPALGEAHPLLTRARALAERLGITVPYALPGPDEASLDLDV
jgi:hypothetical protein